MRAERRRLLRLYARIPEFSCPSECGKCCGPVPWKRAESEMIEAWLGSQGRSLLRGETLPCPYLGGSRCSIYPVRPLLCRLYGTVRRMECPLGRRPSSLLSEPMVAGLMREYLALP